MEKQIPEKARNKRKERHFGSQFGQELVQTVVYVRNTYIGNAKLSTRQLRVFYTYFGFSVWTETSSQQGNVHIIGMN